MRMSKDKYPDESDLYESLEPNDREAGDSRRTTGSDEHDYADVMAIITMRARSCGAMSFLEHLEEFRWTVARSVLAFIVGVIVVAIFHKQIAVLMQMPLFKAYGSAEVARENLITYKAMGVISVFFQIALLGGLTLSMPFVFYFIGSFVAPGLNPRSASYFETCLQRGLSALSRRCFICLLCHLAVDPEFYGSAESAHGVRYFLGGFGLLQYGRLVQSHGRGVFSVPAHCSRVGLHQCVDD